MIISLGTDRVFMDGYISSNISGGGFRLIFFFVDQSLIEIWYNLTSLNLKKSFTMNERVVLIILFRFR